MLRCLRGQPVLKENRADDLRSRPHGFPFFMLFVQRYLLEVAMNRETAGMLCETVGNSHLAAGKSHLAAGKFHQAAGINRKAIGMLREACQFTTSCGKYPRRMASASESCAGVFSRTPRRRYSQPSASYLWTPSVW